MFKCPHCETISPNVQWNTATQVKYGNDIVFVADDDMDCASFICPNCGTESDGFELTHFVRRPAEST